MKSRLISWGSVWILAALAIVLVAASVFVAIRQIGDTPPSGAGADWPIYLHDPQRTSASNDTILSSADITRLTKHWTFKTGGVIAGAAAVVKGTVYVGSWDGYEYALDANTGKLKWKTFLGIVK